MCCVDSRMNSCPIALYRWVFIIDAIAYVTLKFNRKQTFANCEFKGLSTPRALGVIVVGYKTVLFPDLSVWVKWKCRWFKCNDVALCKNHVHHGRFTPQGMDHSEIWRATLSMETS